MQGSLLYNCEGKWVEVPAWARYFLNIGAAMAAPAAMDRSVLCLAVPSRSYAAALTACGIVTARAAQPVEQASPAEHFEMICNLPIDTPVSLLKGDKKLKGVFNGCTDYKEMKCALIMVQQKSVGGASYLIREADALQVGVLPFGPVNLPKRQSGRLVPSVAPFVRNILGNGRALDFVRQSRLECVLTGRINTLRREIVETEFAVFSDSATYHAGSLQDLLQVRKFLNVGESHRSDICRVNGKAPAFDKDGIVPPFVIFDGATGFIRWHDYLRKSN